MKKTLQTSYKGLDIKVVNTWFSGLSVYVDGEKIAFTDKVVHLDKDDPVLTASVETKDGPEALAVFVEALTRVRILLQMNGETIARVD